MAWNQRQSARSEGRRGRDTSPEGVEAAAAEPAERKEEEARESSLMESPGEELSQDRASPPPRPAAHPSCVHAREGGDISGEGGRHYPSPPSCLQLCPIKVFLTQVLVSENTSESFYLGC